MSKKKLDQDNEDGQADEVVHDRVAQSIPPLVDFETPVEPIKPDIGAPITHDHPRGGEGTF